MTRTLRLDNSRLLRGELASFLWLCKMCKVTDVGVASIVEALHNATV